MSIKTNVSTVNFNTLLILHLDFFSLFMTPNTSYYLQFTIVST